MRIFKRSIIFLMLIFFLISAFTGIVKIPETQKYFQFVYNFISASRLSFIHDWSGVVLIILIIIHLILKRKWFLKIFETSQPISKKTVKIFSWVIIFVLAVAGVYFLEHSIRQNNTVKLSAVEVRDYNGEKLGSIDDFRENSIKGPQYIDRNTYKLEVTGLVDKPAEYSYDDLLKQQNYEKVVTLDCVEGWSVKALWKGILVRGIIKNLGIKPDANTVIFYAADGYSTSFPLDYIMNNNIIMAYDLNGVELPPERGFPFQLVAEQKWGYKWIKWITKIELSNDSNYRGYWESRGYNNNGDLKGPEYETN